MNLWPGQLPALLKLDENGRYSCSLPNTAGRLLVSGKCADTQTGQNDFAVESA